mmetsp:Transcript_4803/g.10594  ORF Transcript_4803/g.10594 Transcript_4803/m.10594 type:complete len:248 (-) Transcript_4803:395-1138(-)|eukprot:CAMPEP_0168163952 /NCGR_PEP_ID=MMETSP0139_2-20121125/663_1 /TAXON_ID=44445 /ORGANISM="Pseudo-nitzschia australis, Strain 10249 10 AB" /LENGTH=247 /DNA_ID=CAMNT_0008080907 /DNA_START=197 /DNA_END=940 /DNA_ORIENTATION=+
MILFMATYHTSMEYRSVCAAVFAEFTEEMEKRDAGDCQILGQWISVGDGTGHVVFRAPNATAAGSWAQNWITACSCHVRPVVDDHQARKIILAKSSEHQEPTQAAAATAAAATEFDATFYDRVGDDAPEGHSLFLVRWKFDVAHRVEAMLVFAGLTEEDHQLDRGDVVMMGRYHSIGDGTGMVVCAAKSEFDLHKWAYNWCHLTDITIHPVMSAREARGMIKSKPGFAMDLAKAKAAGLIGAADAVV